MSDWVIRSAVPEDENCIVSMWLKGQMHATDARECGLSQASVDGSPDEITYWRVLQPIVTALVRTCDVRVACDPGRVEYEPGRPAVIWGWACMSEGLVHGVGIKRSVVRLDEGRGDIARELARDLLDGRLDVPQRTTFDLVDLSRLKVIPATWKRERHFLSTLRSMSTRMLDGDNLFARIGAHVLDQRRETWRPGEERAA